MKALELLATLRIASPALPIGGFSYSQGLELAIEKGWLRSPEDIASWLSDQLQLNLGRFEAPLAARLITAVEQGVGDGDWREADRLHALHLASRETAELRAETEQMGRSLLQLLAGLPNLPEAVAARVAQLRDADAPCSLAMAWALAAAGLGVPSTAALVAYLWAWLENQMTAAMKTVPLGQLAGQRLLSQLTPLVSAVAERAPMVPEEAWSNFAPRFAAASSWHETQYSRLFRS